MKANNANEAVLQYAVRLGDDALILGHRLSEWCSNAPFLEEDLALTNVALDYVGRARMFYSYAAELSGDGRSEDSFAYLRDCREFTNLLLHELPRGDFAFTMARQYLVDEYALAFMQALLDSEDKRLAGIAAKAVKESNTICAAAATGCCASAMAQRKATLACSLRWMICGVIPTNCLSLTRWRRPWSRRV